MSDPLSILQRRQQQIAGRMTPSTPVAPTTSKSIDIVPEPIEEVREKKQAPKSKV